MERYIDFDTHVYEPIDVWTKYIDPKFRDRAPQWVDGPEGRLYLKMAEQIFPKVPGHPGFANTYGPQSKMDRSGNDPNVRLKRMDEEHTQIHVIYPTLGMMGFATSVVDPKLAVAQAEAYNRYMGEFCAADPKRLRGAMLTPFNHPELAAQEMRRAHKEYGFTIVYCQPTPPGDIPWSDPSRDPVWRTAEELGLTVVFHESTPGAPSNAIAINRFTTNWPLIYLATHTVEVMFAFADIILGGTLERFPKLRIGAAEAHIHWVPGWLSLMDQNFGAATNIFKNASGEYKLSLKPSDYFRRNCFVAAFPEDTMIKEALDYAPESIVVISDWPHPIAAEHSEGGLELIANSKGFTARQKKALLIDNPMRFL
jgi:predicted TIM-barrel fold metal-dependent hydrolase